MCRASKALGGESDRIKTGIKKKQTSLSVICCRICCHRVDVFKCCKSFCIFCIRVSQEMLKKPLNCFQKQEEGLKQVWNLSRADRMSDGSGLKVGGNCLKCLLFVEELTIL